MDCNIHKWGWCVKLKSIRLVSILPVNFEMFEYYVHFVQFIDKRRKLR